MSALTYLMNVSSNKLLVHIASTEAILSTMDMDDNIIEGGDGDVVHLNPEELEEDEKKSKSF